MADYLQFLKWEEFMRTKHDFLPFLPIQDVMTNITSSYLYSVLKKLPKGGNMHTHESEFDNVLVHVYIIQHHSTELHNRQPIIENCTRETRNHAQFIELLLKTPMKFSRFCFARPRVKQENAAGHHLELD